jgi:ParB family chromosome partitioning protein
MSNLQLIPLNRLIVSRLNVRRTDRKADIDALAASISAHGLLQNLTVSPTETDKFEVVAGGRRHAALKSLAKSGAIARDFAVPCQIIESGGASEVSLAENVQRVAMDAMDEVDAFSSLAEAGQSVDDIARRFGIGARHVEQRLALAALSPKIKGAYRRGDVTLDAARAFCLVDDHSKQEAVFKSLSKPITHSGSVRSQLMQGRMRHTDRLARFVGLEAYEAAGGTLKRDLFETDGIYVDDPALINKLAHDRLDAVRNDALSQGWAWVEVNINQHRFESAYGARLQPTRRAMTEEEQAEADRLAEEIEALEEALDDAEDDDERWARLDTASAELETLRTSTQEWDVEMKRHAGVILSIGHDGAANFAYGVVRKADQKKINDIRRRRELEEAKRNRLDASDHDCDADDTDGDSQRGDDGNTVADMPDTGPRLPKALMSELTLARTRAIRLKVSQNPDMALSLCVFALARSSFAHQTAHGIDVRAETSGISDHEALEEARSALADRAPGGESDLLAWCMDQTSDDLQTSLAMLVAETIDLRHEGVGSADRRLQVIGDQIATALDLNMTQFWKPDLEFWSRLPKAMLLDALAASPALSVLDEGERAALLKAHAKLKKDALALAVEHAFDGAGWLPEVLKPAPEVVSFEVTDAGLAALEAAA